MDHPTTQALAEHSANIVAATTGPWQFLATICVMATIITVAYLLMRRSVDKDTMDRKYTRDREQADQDNRHQELKRTVEGLGKSFDTHCIEHNKVDEELMRLDSAVVNLKENIIYRSEFIKLCETVNQVNLNVAVMVERFNNFTTK